VRRCKQRKLSFLSFPGQTNVFSRFFFVSPARNSRWSMQVSRFRLWSFSWEEVRVRRPRPRHPPLITLKTSQVAEKGRTATPTRRSATASDTMKRFVTDLSLDEQKTAAMTRQLPTMTMTLMRASTDKERSNCGSPQLTASRSAAHADAFSVFCITLALFRSILSPTSLSSPRQLH
jgi:hypothetical protein